jgi:hypothetical protein
MSRATAGDLAEVDGGAAGEAPRSARWSHDAAQDWGGVQCDGDGRDRVGSVDDRSGCGGRGRCELTTQ